MGLKPAWGKGFGRAVKDTFWYCIRNAAATCTGLSRLAHAHTTRPISNRPRREFQFWRSREGFSNFYVFESMGSPKSKETNFESTQFTTINNY